MPVLAKVTPAEVREPGKARPGADMPRSVQHGKRRKMAVVVAEAAEDERMMEETCAST